MKFGFLTLGWVLVGLLGCSDAGGDLFEPGSSGSGGGGSGTGGSGTGGSGGLNIVLDGGGSETGPASNCAEETKFVYVIDDKNRMYKFDPTIPSNAAFSLIGTMGCQGGDGPNSMSVGRDGYAYVLYGTQNTFTGGYSCAGVLKVDITTAQCAGPSSFQCGSAGFEKFGMGFSTDTASTSSEALYLSNSLQPGLGRVDFASGAITRVGNLPGAAEFTGNAKGELWGFFPDVTPPAVLQIDKATGGVLTTFSLSGLPPIGFGGYAYAFAFWGGSFYIFYQVDDYDDSTNVWRLDGNGSLTKYIPNTNLRIVGAGVSTCAPVEPPK